MKLNYLLIGLIVGFLFGVWLFTPRPRPNPTKAKAQNPRVMKLDDLPTASGY